MIVLLLHRLIPTILHDIFPEGKGNTRIGVGLEDHDAIPLISQDNTNMV